MGPGIVRGKRKSEGKKEGRWRGCAVTGVGLINSDDVKLKLELLTTDRQTDRQTQIQYSSFLNSSFVLSIISVEDESSTSQFCSLLVSSRPHRLPKRQVTPQASPFKYILVHPLTSQNTP